MKSDVEIEVGIFAKEADSWSSVMLLSKQVLPYWHLNLIAHWDVKTCSVFSLVDMKKRLKVTVAKDCSGVH